jgi:nicotinate-nucleotide adenylyltransferase
MKTVILGGTYNPVHIGHLMLADEVREAFGYERVVFVPSYRPPHKKVAWDIAPEHRLAMLRLAVEGFPGAVVEDCEIKRGSVSYTIDTIAYVASHYDVEGKPGLVIGDDLAEGFSDWRDPGRIADACDLIVAHRNRIEEVELGYPHRYLDNMLLPISSTEIRERIGQGRPFRYLVPKTVYEYIVREHVYGRID